MNFMGITLKQEMINMKLTVNPIWLVLAFVFDIVCWVSLGVLIVQICG